MTGTIDVAGVGYKDDLDLSADGIAPDDVELGLLSSLHGITTPAMIHAHSTIKPRANRVLRSVVGGGVVGVVDADDLVVASTALSMSVCRVGAPPYIGMVLC